MKGKNRFFGIDTNGNI